LPPGGRPGSFLEDCLHTPVGGSRQAAVAVWACGVLLAGSLGCAGGGGRGAARPTAVPDFVKTTGPCFVGGRISLDPTLFPKTADDELAALSCENLVVVQKSEDGSTLSVHADGFFAQGYGECHYQFTDVPVGTSSYSGRVVALSVPESRYALTSAVEFNTVHCGGSIGSLNQQLDFLLTIPDVRGR
jgi:hypothetical protein